MEIRSTVLIDNIATPPLLSEWGLSLLIEYRGRRILLDMGKSEGFALNAGELSLPLSEADFAVLSHAHYDHADGMEHFFSRNSRAKLYLREGTEENCYSGDGADRHYIGIQRGALLRFADSIAYCGGAKQLFEGAWLLPHTEDMTAAGKRAKMYLLHGEEWAVDTFRHEQSLVLETEKGLVVFNSCCHGGADVVIREAEKQLGQPVYALVGGLHLFRSNDDYIMDMAERLKQTGVQRIITGHCTGEHGFELLKAVLDAKIQQMYSGMSFEM